MFITIVFGLAFPLFYIVCILSFVIKYTVERYTLARFYKLPKKHSQLLTDQNYRIQAGMPLFGFLIAFWMFGNKQMYDTKVHEIDTEYQLLNSYHTIGKTAKNLFTEYFASISGLESICITSFVAISIFYSVAFVLYRQSKKLQKHLNFKNKLPDYFDALTYEQLLDIYNDDMQMKEFESNSYPWQTLEEMEQMLENKRVYSTNGDNTLKMVGQPTYLMQGVHDVFKNFNNQNAE